jgi:hypothetical protein
MLKLKTHSGFHDLFNEQGSNQRSTHTPGEHSNHYITDVVCKNTLIVSKLWPNTDPLDFIFYMHNEFYK